MEATTPTAKSKRRLRRKRRELDALVVGVSANGRPPRHGAHTSSSSDSSSCGGDDPEAGLCPPRASSSSSGGGCRRREEVRKRCGRRHSRCPGGRGSKGTGRRCLSSRPRGTLPLAVRGAGACMAVACLLGAATALAWLFLDARHQTDSLRVHLDAVVAGSKGVPDALQKCHSMSKELQHNQTLLLAQLMALSSQFANFSLQVKDVHRGLSEVESRLKGSPALVTLPHELGELTDSVGQLGSRLGGLDASVGQLKASNIVLQNETDTLRQEVTNLKEAVLQLSNASANVGSANMEGGGTADTRNEEDLEKSLGMLHRDLFELKANVSRLNETVLQRLLFDEKELSSNQGVSSMLSNFSARLITLESSCSSVNEYNKLSSAVDHFSSQVNETLNQIQSKINQLFGKMNKQESSILRNGSVASEPNKLSPLNSSVTEAPSTDDSIASSSSEKPAGLSAEKVENATIASLIHSTAKSTGEENAPIGLPGEVNKKEQPFLAPK